mmetsp:Transcript_17102/g.22199  ORF Transcript_17102/g.22199 Transcript_17102/m.22199 type:complete len:434 (+) Transcript_17102:107-1408(+)
MSNKETAPEDKADANFEVSKILTSLRFEKNQQKIAVGERAEATIGKAFIQRKFKARPRSSSLTVTGQMLPKKKNKVDVKHNIDKKQSFCVKKEKVPGKPLKTCTFTESVLEQLKPRKSSSQLGKAVDAEAKQSDLTRSRFIALGMTKLSETTSSALKKGSVGRRRRNIRLADVQSKKPVVVAGVDCDNWVCTTATTSKVAPPLPPAPSPSFCKETIVPSESPSISSTSRRAETRKFIADGMCMGDDLLNSESSSFQRKHSYERNSKVSVDKPLAISFQTNSSGGRNVSLPSQKLHNSNREVWYSNKVTGYGRIPNNMNLVTPCQTTVISNALQINQSRQQPQTVHVVRRVMRPMDTVSVFAQPAPAPVMQHVRRPVESQCFYTQNANLQVTGVPLVPLQPVILTRSNPAPVPVRRVVVSSNPLVLERYGGQIM